MRKTRNSSRTMDVSVDDLFEKIRQSEQEALGRKAALTERGKLNIFILAFLFPDRSSGLFINILWYRCNKRLNLTKAEQNVWISAADRNARQLFSRH